MFMSLFKVLQAKTLHTRAAFLRLFPRTIKIYMVITGKLKNTDSDTPK